MAAVGDIKMTTVAGDQYLCGSVAYFGPWRERGYGLNLRQRAVFHGEDTDFRIRLMIDIEEAPVRRQLQAPRACTCMGADERRGVRRKRGFGGIHVIAI